MIKRAYDMIPPSTGDDSKAAFRGFDQGTLRLSAPTRFSERYISTHLLAQLTCAVEPELGPVREVVFVAP